MPATPCTGRLERELLLWENSVWKMPHLLQSTHRECADLEHTNVQERYNDKCTRQCDSGRDTTKHAPPTPNRRFHGAGLHAPFTRRYQCNHHGGQPCLRARDWTDHRCQRAQRIIHLLECRQTGAFPKCGKQCGPCYDHGQVHDRSRIETKESAGCVAYRSPRPGRDRSGKPARQRKGRVTFLIEEHIFALCSTYVKHDRTR